jgi:hypothetical protein
MPSCFLVIVSQRTSVNVYDPDIFNCFGQMHLFTAARRETID